MKRVPWVLPSVLLVACAALAACDEPAVSSGVEPGEALPGGDTTNTLLLGRNAFIRPVANLTEANSPLFYSGNSFFNQAWVEAPASTTARDGLGPLFNARSCAACHFKDGRGRPPLSEGEDFVGLLLRISVPGEGPYGAPVPEPNYGGQLQPFGLPGVPAEATLSVTYTEVKGAYADGTPYTLLDPTYHVDDPAYGPLADDVLVSPRVANSMVGGGLLEAIPEARLQALSDPDDADGDGISGRVSRVWDDGADAWAVGRFGWKASQPTLRAQAAGAFLGDMGMTTSLHVDQDCTDAQTECKAAMDGGAPEIDDSQLDRVERYLQLLAVPVRRGWDQPEVLRGKALFGEAGCASCHTPSHTTGVAEGLPELSEQLIWPYTDMLLHDMGPGLSDGRPAFGADGPEWRTPPLWGVGLIPDVNDHDRLLHDGRARGVAEAILWHGGEGEASREAFRAMDATERAALVRFVESL